MTKRPPTISSLLQVATGRIILMLLLLCIAAVPAIAQEVQYEVIDLGAMGQTGQGSHGQPSAINNSAQVVGQILVGTTWRAFLWQDGKMIDLGTLGGESAIAYGINDAGQVVGWSALPWPERNKGFLWEDGVMIELPTFGGPYGDNARAFGINAAGQVVGEAGIEICDQDGHCGPGVKAVLWDDSSMTDLGHMEVEKSHAMDINNDAQVAGDSYLVGGIRRAFLWQSGTMIDLGTLGGNWSSALAINNGGRVVGGALDSGGFWRAFLWTDGTMADLGTLDVTSLARDINDAGLIVGCSGASGTSCLRAFVWEEGVMLDLNDLIDPDQGWDLLDATGINDHGQIVGTGMLDGNLHGFLLTPLECFVVTELTDEPDDDPGDGTCDTGSGDCTLRAAIQEANALEGKQCITFNIKDSGGNPVADPVITPLTALPAIIDSLSIDGTTQPESDRVGIAGGSAGNEVDGLRIEDTHDVSLRGLAIYDFDGVGVRITGGSDHEILRTFIGHSGSETKVNEGGGLHISGGATSVTIGSLEMEDANFITDGIVIDGNDTHKITILKNTLEVPSEWIGSGAVRLPLDLGQPGPSCLPWSRPTHTLPNQGMPSPRIVNLTESRIQGFTVPHSTVIAYKVPSTGSGNGRYWPRRLDPWAHRTASDIGYFSFTTVLNPGDRIALVAIDSVGNTSEPTQLRRPVVVIPGAGGSWLTGPGTTERWLPLAWESDDKNERIVGLEMHPDGTTSVEPIAANQVLEAVGATRLGYGPLHDRLQGAGFSGHPDNLSRPNLDQWRFAYDWRLGIEKAVAEIEQLIEELTTGSGGAGAPARSCSVDLVAHGTGGLIASLYLVENPGPAPDRLHRVITSGTPYLGTPDAVALHAGGSVLSADEMLSKLNYGTWDVAWGDVIAAMRNVAAGYSLLPSRAYYEAIDSGSSSHAHGFTTVNLYNDPLAGYDATHTFLTSAKENEGGLADGLARNASIWQAQQTGVHAHVNNWGDYIGPPQIFRQVGLVAASTPTGWVMGPGPNLIPTGGTPRDEAGDTDFHRAFRERLQPVWGVGDGVVPLASASLGRNPLDGDTDYSGVDSHWIAEFDYYKCRHGALVASGCKALSSGSPDALDRIVEILQSGHRVQAASAPRPASPRTLAEGGIQAEVFYTLATAPIAVRIVDAEGRVTGPVDGSPPGAVEYGIPGIKYRATTLGASFALAPDSAYTITVTSADPDARVFLTRQRAGLDGLTQILYADQALSEEGVLIFALTEGGTPDDAVWHLDVDGDGTPNEEIPPAAILSGTSAVPALPIPQPLAFQTGVAVDGTATRILRIPDTGTVGWSYQLEGGDAWLTVAATGGSAPAEIELHFDAGGLPEGPISTTLALTLANVAYETTLPVPVTMHVGVTVDTEPGTPSSLPDRLVLAAPYPNPTSNLAVLRYGLPAASDVRLEVLDILGRRVVLLADDRQDAGWQEIIFDGSRLPAGMYVVRLHSGPAIRMQRVTVVR